MDSLPFDLLAEILSYNQDETTFEGFQLALTCRSAYDKLQPSLARIQIDDLLDLHDRGHLGVVQLRRSEADHCDEGFHPRWTLMGNELQRLCLKDYFEAAFGISAPRGEGDELATFPPHFEIRYVLHPETGFSARKFYSLHSLLAREVVSRGLRRVQLVWGRGLWSHLFCKGREVPKWQNILAKLLGKLVGINTAEDSLEWEGVELQIVGHCSRPAQTFRIYRSELTREPSPFFSHRLRETNHTLPGGSFNVNFGSESPGPKAKEDNIVNRLLGKLRNNPKLKSSWMNVKKGNSRKPPGMISCWNVHSSATSTQFPGSFLTPTAGSTCLHDSAILYFHLQILILRSSSTLTHLHLDSCPDQFYNGLAGPLDWHAMFRSWPRFDRLTHFKVTNTGTLPVPVILSFLRYNPTIEAVHLVMHPVRDYHLPKTVAELMGLEVHFKDLTATPWVLSALLSFRPVLCHLESLAICQVKASEWDETTTEWERITQFIYAQSERRCGLGRLKLTFEDGYRLEDWLRRAVASSTFSQGDGGSTLQEPVGEYAVAKALVSCHDITFIHLSLSKVPDSFYLDPHVVVKFAAAFPQLQTLVLQGTFYNAPEHQRDENAGAFWRVLHRLWDVCTRLQMLEIRDLSEGSKANAAVWIDGRQQGPNKGYDIYLGAFPWINPSS
ncbi:hypothetical protein DFP72DRAFT_925860 [Ephemerocybe angulata]|uniref:Uncharacterized protein n=1 Tax=Ephemerocybe angulata TaxID=980116 RepID=A0A8H6LWP1_9AGAR|nr:hypothetical protein DFP72DRAFT_925860 [Tulosesus angulatus]